VNVRNIGIGVRAVDQRASVLDASNLMEEAALDRYEFIRDGYLQRRRSRVFDGESGPQKEAPQGESKGEAKPAPASNTQVVPEPATSCNRNAAEVMECRKA
jgi:phospholipid-binding lipoprotein MlaA